MGDVVLYILICDDLLPNHSSEKASPGAAIAALPCAKSNGSMSEQSDNLSREFRFSSITCTLSADATLAELVNVILSNISVPTKPNLKSEVSDAKILRGQQLDQITILDVSYPPVKVITSPVKIYTEMTGPLSKTLHGMGWYPSGKLVILPSPQHGHPEIKEAPMASTHDSEIILLEKFLKWHSRQKEDEEFAYNLPNGNQSSAVNEHDEVSRSERVKWVGQGAVGNHFLKPSDIFIAVEQRFDDSATDNNIVDRKRHSKKTLKRSVEKERQERLDFFLQNLRNVHNKGNKKKTKAVSQKVRTMLLKSRSEGNMKLRMEDRFHLEIITYFDDGSDDSNSDHSNSTMYRFFSSVTTAGRVASTVAPSLGNDRAAEFLVPLSPANQGVNWTCSGGENSKRDPIKEKIYKRLPNTMTLHEARSAGWLAEFDVVVVRVYCIKSDGHGQGQHGPSRSVLDSDVDDVDDEEGNDDIHRNQTQSCSKSITHTAMSNVEDLHLPAMSSAEANKTQTEDESQQQLQNLIQNMFTTTNNVQTDNDKLSRKKKKPVTQKVQHMLLKSKATGNAKLKQEDRIYLEIIMFHDDGSSSANNVNQRRSISCHFFSKCNNIQHVFDKLVDDQATRNEFIFATLSDENGAEKEVYKKLPPTLRLGLAVEMGLLSNFDRVLIRSTNCDKITSVPLYDIEKSL